MFDIENTLSFNADKLVAGTEYDYVTRTSLNQGVLQTTGFINQDNINLSGIWSLGLLSMDFFYRCRPLYAGQFVRKIIPKISIPEKATPFFSTILNKQKSSLLSVLVRNVDKTFRNIIVKLPETDEEKIDFAFMESFIAELEAQRIAELEAYLQVTGLDNYELTAEEENALVQIYNSEWQEFKAGQLFTKIKTKKLPYKAKDLPTAPSGNNVLPCLTSSFHNQGLNYYAPREGATILKHVITVPSNSDVYRAYYQSREFTVLSDAYAIRWKDEKRSLSFKQYLFMVQSINKITDLPIYSYKNKFGGWNTLKEQLIQLPVKNNEIDFELIELFVSAIVKTAIKDVVLYSQRKMSLYQRVSLKDKPVVYSIPKPVELRVAEDVPVFKYGKGKKNK